MVRSDLTSLLSCAMPLPRPVLPSCIAGVVATVIVVGVAMHPAPHPCLASADAGSSLLWYIVLSYDTF